MAGSLVGCPAAETDDALIIKIDFTVGDGCQSHHRTSQSCLAAARFPHQAKHIAPIQRKAQTVYGLDGCMVMQQQTFPNGKVDVQVFNPQKGIIAVCVDDRIPLSINLLKISSFT